MTVTGSINPTALEEVNRILRPGGISNRDSKDGYIDLLDDEDVLRTHRGQRIFAGKLVPLIYEHLWRPLVSRFFFGPFGPGARKERQIVLKMLGITPGDRVIDLGCGTGNYTRYLAREADDGLVVGIDASPTMLAKAAKRGGGANIAYVRGDARVLPFDDGEFDVASSVGVLHMLEEWETALAEMVRVMAPGGRLAVATLCNTKNISRKVIAGGQVFGLDELPHWFTNKGLVDVEQRTMGWSQFVSARKPAEDQVGR